MALRTKLITGSAALFIILGCGTSNAADPAENITVTGNVAVTSDYVFRGISFSDEDPAIQGAADVAHSSGLYTNLFLSSVDKPFGASYNQVGGEEDFEHDIAAGWRRQFGVFKDYGVDVGVINYGFSDNPDDIDWAEVYAAANWRWFSVRYHTDIAGMDMGDYYRAGFRYTIAKRYTVRLIAGHYDLDRNLRETHDYTHYGAGVSTDFKGFNFEVMYHDTDDEGEQRYLQAAGDRFVLTISKGFNIYP